MYTLQLDSNYFSETIYCNATENILILNVILYVYSQLSHNHISVSRIEN